MVTLYITHESGMFSKCGEAVSYKLERNGKEEVIPLTNLDEVVLLGRGEDGPLQVHRNILRQEAAAFRVRIYVTGNVRKETTAGVNLCPLFWGSSEWLNRNQR